MSHSMAMVSEGVGEALMRPKHEYSSVGEEEKGWRRGLILGIVTSVVWIAVVVSVSISLRIVFDEGRSGLCQPISADDDASGSFYLTEKQAADYFWMVVFLPTAILFSFSLIYLLSGVLVAYSAPARHGCLRVVENNYCASKRGGVRCLAILNVVFAVIFGVLALFLGSSLLTFASSCSLPLFWCYEIASWGLVILYGGTAFFLRRNAAAILDEGEFGGRNFGLEMLEATPRDVSPEVERKVKEGFKAWMGSSLLSSDEEDGPDDYQEIAYPVRANSGRQHV